MHWLLIVALLLFIYPHPAAAQGDVSALTDQFDTLVPTLLQQGKVPGAALALIHDGAVVWSQGYGAADEAAQTPVTADTAFSVESISKALTAWEIMRMVEAGRLDLDAPVNQYLTSWQLTGAGRNDSDGATIRRILSHTAGLSVDGYRGYPVGTADLPSLPDFLSGDAGVPAVRMLFPAGARFSYSGGGYTILQLMIEDLTGEPFADVMQRDLLDRLGMAHSRFGWSADAPLDWATHYLANGQVDDTIIHEDLAAGGLFTTADDLARFLTAGLDGGFLTPESVAQMLTPAEATKGEYGFGYFLFALKDGTPVAWHDGIGVGQRAIFFLLPQSGDGLVILTNKGNGNRVFRQIVCAWDAWLHGAQTGLCKSY